MKNTKPQIYLWLDDVRDPVDHGKIGWLWVKTYEEAISAFQNYDVLAASLDHDLGIMSTIGLDSEEKTGYHVVCWMEEHGVYPIGGVMVHSQNPVGAQKMRKALSRMASIYRG